MKNYTFNDLQPLIEGKFEIFGDTSLISFDKATALNDADEKSICWLSPTAKNKTDLIENTKTKIIICHLNEPLREFADKIFIKTANPRLFFSRLVKAFFVSKIQFGIHPSAIIHPEASIHEETYIGPNVIIGKCTIGHGTIIYGNCYIFENTIIEENVTIMPNTTIGGSGFGYEKNSDGEFELFPHIGGVHIEKNVDIGANTCIDRGTLGNTIIGAGSKIDNLVHIAHNVTIGRNCAIIAHAMIGGSTVINDNCWVAPSACVRDGISIGSNSTIGLGSVVIKTIPDNEIWAGNPARKFEKK